MVLAFQPVIFDRDVASLDAARFAQPLQKAAPFRAAASAAPPLSKAITGIADCCARAASWPRPPRRRAAR